MSQRPGTPKLGWTGILSLSEDEPAPEILRSVWNMMQMSGFPERWEEQGGLVSRQDQKPLYCLGLESSFLQQRPRGSLQSRPASIRVHTGLPLHTDFAERMLTLKSRNLSHGDAQSVNCLLHKLGHRNLTPHTHI